MAGAGDVFFVAAAGHRNAARVVEEVVVRKEATERTETVRDDVRREQVEVQDANQRRS